MRQPERPRHRSLALGLVALGLLCAGVLTSGTGSTPPTETPSPERVVRRAPPERTSPEPGPMTDTLFAAETLHVWLRPLTRPRYTALVAPPAQAALWPEGPPWDLAALDAYATLHAVREVLDRRGHFRRAPHLVPLAEADGLLDPSAPPATPEEAFARMLALQVRAEVEREAAWGPYFDRHLAEGESWESISGAKRAEILANENSPPFHTAELEALTEATQTRWPDHPVADHAQLARLWSTLRKIRDEPVGAEIADLLHAFDPAFQEQAALLVVGVGPFNAVSPEVLEALGEMTSVDVQHRMRIDAYIANRAAGAERWDLVARAADRLAADVARDCAEDPLEHVCAGRAYEIREHRARLIALGRAEPRTWEEAVTARVWTCHLQPLDHEGTARGRLIWEGIWRSEGWDRETPITRCLDADPPDLGPSEPTALTLTIER